MLESIVMLAAHPEEAQAIAAIQPISRTAKACTRHAARRKYPRGEPGYENLLTPETEL